MGSSEEDPGDNVCPAGDSLATPGCARGSVEDWSPEDDELLLHSLCHMVASPGLSLSAGKESEEEDRDARDSLSSLVCSWFIGGPRSTKGDGLDDVELREEELGSRAGLM